MPHTGRARVILRATSKVLINAAVSIWLGPRRILRHCPTAQELPGATGLLPTSLRLV